MNAMIQSPSLIVPGGGTTTPVRARTGWSGVRRGYILLETVIATGLLIVGLGVIGVQIQDSEHSIRKMERRMRAMLLAEQYFAYMDLGLVELDSVDEVQEGDFGSRDPDWGWRLITEPIAVDGMYRLSLEILHYIREDDYTEDDFEYDASEVIFRTYAFRSAPQSLDLGVDFGLTEEEVLEVSQKMADSGLESFDAQAFDPSVLAKLDTQELIKALPLVLDVLGLELGELKNLLPPEVLEELERGGLFGGDEGESDEPAEGGEDGGS